MCGIVGYIGKNNAVPILLDGLRSLEYRGYDSAGVYVQGVGCIKSVGVIDNLEAKIPNEYNGVAGIGHTRWATHGEPSEHNAHPQSDESGRVFVVHNGIIENYREISQLLTEEGHTFSSETDTEVIAHLVEKFLNDGKNFKDAVVEMLKCIKGAYGIAVACKDKPDELIVARMGSPLVIGLSLDEYFIASDPSALLRHTRDIIYLNDGDIAVVGSAGHRVFTLKEENVDRKISRIDWDFETVKKDGYAHFMLKEIMEAPTVIENSMRGRLLVEQGSVKLGGIQDISEDLRSIKNVVIVGCGSAYYAGLVGRMMIEELAGIPTVVELGSEFRYKKSVIEPRTLVIAVSQSGETADTLEAVREAKRKGALTIGIVNTIGSTIARETNAGVYNHAGPEVSVASTKAFISQLVVFALLATFLGRQRDLSLMAGKQIVTEIANLPEKIMRILSSREDIKEIALRFSHYQNFFFIGRKYNYPIAMEGSLKLKEISYIHAEGCGAGELKHGSIALITPDFPTMAICLQDSVYEKMISNVQEINARKGPIVIMTSEDTDVSFLTSDVIRIPHVHEILSPILSVIPLQLFAYYCSVARGLDVDRPRNLAKSVTVE